MNSFGSPEQQYLGSNFEEKMFLENDLEETFTFLSDRYNPLHMERKAIDMEEFRRTYGDEIEKDKETVREIKEKIKHTDSTHLGVFAENLVIGITDSTETFGKGVETKTVKTAEYDDWVNHTDAVIRFHDKKTDSYSHLALDITTADDEKVAQKKLDFIRDDYKKGTLGNVKYYSGRTLGLTNVPKVVLHLGRKELLSFLGEAKKYTNAKTKEILNEEKYSNTLSILASQIREDILGSLEHNLGMFIEIMIDRKEFPPHLTKSVRDAMKSGDVKKILDIFSDIKETETNKTFIEGGIKLARLTLLLNEYTQEDEKNSLQ